MMCAPPLCMPMRKCPHQCRPCGATRFLLIYTKTVSDFCYAAFALTSQVTPSLIISTLYCIVLKYFIFSNFNEAFIVGFRTYQTLLKQWQFFQTYNILKCRVKRKKIQLQWSCIMKVGHERIVSCQFLVMWPFICYCLSHNMMTTWCHNEQHDFFGYLPYMKFQRTGTFMREVHFFPVSLQLPPTVHKHAYEVNWRL